MIPSTDYTFHESSYFLGEPVGTDIKTLQSQIVLDLGRRVYSYGKLDDRHNFTSLFRAFFCPDQKELTARKEKRLINAPDKLIVNTNRHQFRDVEIQEVPTNFTFTYESTYQDAKYELEQCYVQFPNEDPFRVLGKADIQKHPESLRYGSIFEYRKINKPIQIIRTPPISWKRLMWKASIATLGFLWRSFKGGIELLTSTPKRTG